MSDTVDFTQALPPPRLEDILTSLYHIAGQLQEVNVFQTYLANRVLELEAQLAAEKQDAAVGKAIEILLNKYGNSVIEFYYGIVTIGELRKDSEYIKLGEGDSINEALTDAGLLSAENKEEEKG